MPLAAARVPPALRGREVTRLETTQRVVALTFDGGGNDVGAWSLLATLKRKDVRATFFVTARFARLYPRVARAIGAGYVVGNHTVDHPDLTHLSSAAVAREIAGAAPAIRRATGRDPWPLFRFPYGAADARTIAIANRLGYVDVRWAVDTLGWMGRSGGQSPPAMVRHVLAHLGPGAIVLEHIGAARDGSTLDADALPALIDALRARGYRFVTLSSLAQQAK